MNSPHSSEYTVSEKGTLVPRGLKLFEANKEMLHIFDHLPRIYKQLFVRTLHNYPELAEMKILASNSKEDKKLAHTNGFFRAPADPADKPTIVINTEANTSDLVKKFDSTRDISLSYMAKDLGISFDTLKSNPELINIFIFFHEVGHAYDYIKNYVQEYGENAYKINRMNRKDEMTSLPIPRTNPAKALLLKKDGTLEQFFGNNIQHFKEKGITTTAELLQKNEEAYRNLPSEVFADHFAANTILGNTDIIIKDETAQKVDQLLLLKVAPLPQVGSLVHIEKISHNKESTVPIKYETTSIVTQPIEKGLPLVLADGTKTTAITDIKRSKEHIAIQTRTSTYLLYAVSK